MNTQFALVLDNWFPREGEVRARPGWIGQWEMPVDDPVPIALMVYHPNPNDLPYSELLVASDNWLYVYDDNDVFHGLFRQVACTNGDWSGVNFANSAGNIFFWLANGVDYPKYYAADGSYHDLHAASAPIALTGISDSRKLTAPWSYMRRIFAIEKQTMNAWYLPVDSIGGEAKKLPIGALFKHGGYLVAGTSWTQDGGDGSDDLCVFLTSEGEMAVYRGDNPNSAAAWELVGVYFIGRPPSKRCFQKLGGDVAVLTEMGVMPLSKAIRADRMGTATALSDNIRPTIMTCMSDILEKELYGAEILLYPAQNALIVNVPRTLTVQQFVMNTITGAWCSFSNWLTPCFAVWDGQLFMATADGIIAKAWDFDAEGDGDEEAIAATVQTAFSPMGGGSIKKLLQIRPLVIIDKDTLFQYGFVSDYRDAVLTSEFLQEANDPPYWDVAMWGDLWEPLPYRFAKWLTATSVEGYALSIAMRVTSQSAFIAWSGTGYLVEVGGLV